MEEYYVSDSRKDVLALYESFAKENGMTVSLVRTLEAVSEETDCMQKTVCEKLRLSKQRTHLLVSALQERGLIEKKKNRSDGRSVILSLTEEGARTAQRFFELAGKVNSSPQEPHEHVLEDGTVIVHSHVGHGHRHKNTKAALDRLSRSIGHLEKVRRMVENGADCSEVLIQLSAVRAAVTNIGKLIIKDHIEHCLVEAVREGDSKTIDDLNSAIDQFIK